MSRSGRLPPELVARILAESFSVGPVCALSLLAPEWGVCQRKNAILECLLKMTRVDRYLHCSPWVGAGDHHHDV